MGLADAFVAGFRELINDVARLKKQIRVVEAKIETKELRNSGLDIQFDYVYGLLIEKFGNSNDGQQFFFGISKDNHPEDHYPEQRYIASIENDNGGTNCHGKCFSDALTKMKIKIDNAKDLSDLTG